MHASPHMHACTCVPCAPMQCTICEPARRYEVGSGLLVAPGVPDIAERQDMQKLIGEWGGLWCDTWRVVEEGMPV